MLNETYVCYFPLLFIVPASTQKCFKNFMFSMIELLLFAATSTWEWKSSLEFWKNKYENFQDLCFAHPVSSGMTQNSHLKSGN
jgi:hypothetical protein